ncbi:hypothetical protein G7Y89_g12688 [Cudoniella acicularis]|uniref:DUF676 domain-containing protein n=1 Tax=Cudoniella acicularis TaxID=354080 RepID=A0A8H4VWR3_9HELO|nr:hypothetical protein G7Y89_g12688 [Cudoniella acicularis]
MASQKAFYCFAPPWNTEKNFLRPIVTPPDAEIDFVAIHGLNPVNTASHAKKTWTAKDGTEWLSDPRFLPLHFPKARVLLFGYNSNVAIQPSSAGVEQHVRNLLDHLQRERAVCFVLSVCLESIKTDLNSSKKQSPTRPLVFLCHSLGGIIAKRAVVTAKLDGQYGPVYQGTRAFVFLGTPHRGSKKTPFGDIVAKIVRSVRGETDNTFLDALRENSLFSEGLRNGFLALYNDFSFLSFYETQSTKKARVLGMDLLNLGVVVTMTSATLGIPNERVFPRETDHTEVCTYDNPNSDAFNQLVYNLKRIIKGPTTTVDLYTGALVLAAGRGALKQWNFTDQDIATLGGAGRNTVTWITARFKDQSLLEYHKIRAEDLLLRKGIIETAELQGRWGQNIKLLKNGKQEMYQTTVRDDLDAFTWLMSLIYATLNAALSDLHCRDIMMEFVVKLFDGDSEDYLRGELPSHIEGWNSIASVRMIAEAARNEWYRLGSSGEHPPGYIPKTDNKSILDFLNWLTSERTPQHCTASSDVYCLAKVLWTLGVTTLTVVNVERSTSLAFDENELVVIFDQNFVPSTGATTSPASLRRGVRVPLNNMREVVSPWPLPSDESTLLLSEMLEDFSAGEQAGKDLQFTLHCETEIPYTPTTTNQTKADIYYEISSRGSMEKLVHRDLLANLAKDHFLLVTSALRKALHERFQTWVPLVQNFEAILNDEVKFARFQCFVLGYYYGALGQIIVDDQLTTKEAFGSWGWWDKEIFAVVKDLKWETPSKPKSLTNSVYCWRYGLIKVAAYLFAGAELRLIRSPGLDQRATGVVAKICLLTASMIGEGNDAEAASKFFLLDVDRSCIPNTSGIVMSGSRTSPDRETVSPDMLCELPVDINELRGVPEDFTVHIEPDWNNDNQKCMVVYRDNGRIVHRLSPADCDVATVLCAHPTGATQTDRFREIAGMTAPSPENRENVYLIPLSKFHGGKVFARESQDLAVSRWASEGIALDNNDRPFFVPTMGLPRARTCLKAMFFDSLSWIGNTPKEGYKLHPDLEGAYVLYDEEARPIIASWTQEANMELYQYEPLPDPKRHIRLITLEYDSQPNDIRCEIAIDDPEGNVLYDSYYSLSYTWGEGYRVERAHNPQR